MPIQAGDRITIAGGYEEPAEWLGGRDAVGGVIVKWIPVENRAPACVVKLDAPLTATGDVCGKRETRTGSFLVLGLRYVGQQWDDSGTVHVELCEAEPPDVAWGQREPGVWVESHATYVIGKRPVPTNT